VPLVTLNLVVSVKRIVELAVSRRWQRRLGPFAVRIGAWDQADASVLAQVLMLKPGRSSARPGEKAPHDLSSGQNVPRTCDLSI
jgi:hypothetical protein